MNASPRLGTTTQVRPTAHTQSTALATIPAAGAVVWRPGHDKDLHLLVVIQQRPLVLVGHAATTPRHAARDLHHAADRLAILAGFDVTSALPGHDQLVEYFAASAPRLATAPGGAAARILMAGLQGSGVVVCMSVGSGTLPVLPAWAGAGSPADAIANYVRLTRPTGVFASRVDRYSRSPHGHATLLNELVQLDRSSGAWAGDGHTGRWDLQQQSTQIMLDMMTTAGAAERAVASKRAMTSRQRRDQTR